MTGNEKKITEIFSFIAWVAVKLKFYLSVCGFGSKICSKLPNTVTIQHRPRFWWSKSALINFYTTFPIRTFKTAPMTEQMDFDRPVLGTLPIVGLAGATRPVKPQLYLRQNRRRLRRHLGQLGVPFQRVIYVVKIQLLGYTHTEKRRSDHNSPPKKKPAKSVGSGGFQILCARRGRLRVVFWCCNRAFVVIIRGSATDIVEQFCNLEFCRCFFFSCQFLD